MFSSSSLYVHVGQCGNQIGKFQSGEGISVDSEPKVVSYKSGSSCAIYEQSGRGSNWALGYTSGQYLHHQRENEKKHWSNRGSLLERQQQEIAGKHHQTISKLSDSSEDTDATAGDALGVIPKRPSVKQRSAEVSKIYGRRGILNRVKNNSTSVDGTNIVSNAMEICGESTMGNANSQKRTESLPTALCSNSIGFVNHDQSYANASLGEGPSFSFDEGSRATGRNGSTNGSSPIQNSCATPSSEPYLVHAVKKRVYDRIHCRTNSECVSKNPLGTGTRARDMPSIDKLILVHSVGGGTGSGLGSRLLEELSDLRDFENTIDFTTAHYSSKVPVISASIMPIYSVSETCLQAYNACFSLAWIQDFCSGAVIFENEKLLLTKDLVMEGESESFSVTTRPRNDKGESAYNFVNKYIARTLDTVDWSDFLLYSTPMPSHRFTQAFSYNISGSFGGSVLNGGEYEHKKILKKLTMCHTPTANTVLSSTVSNTRQIPQQQNLRLIQAQAVLYNPNLSLLKTEWLPKAVDWNQNFCIEQKHVDVRKNIDVKTLPDVNLILNWSRMATIVSTFLETAKKKYSGRAFVHWYHHYGVEEADFEQVFESCHEIIDNYSTNIL